MCSKKCCPGTSDHHGLAVVAVVGLAAAVAWLRIRHALAHFADVVIHWAIVAGIAGLVAAVVFVSARFAVRNRGEIRQALTHFRVGSPAVVFSFRHGAWLRNLPRAIWAAVRWPWLARNLSLAYVDKHVPGKVRRPRAIIHPGKYGVVTRARTIPGVGLAEFEKAAEHIRNAHRAVRIGITQPRPGRIQIRSLCRDPLAEPLPPSVVPVWDGRHVMLGRDEFGAMRRASLANLAGSIWAGNPGRGKTEAALSLAVQLGASPLVDLWMLDGGACDWAHFANGAAGYVADDLEAAADMLTGLDETMRTRRRNLEADLGVRNGWARGPSEAYRLQWVMVEEAPFYLSLDAVKGDKKREAQVAVCRGAVGNLLRRGRAPMFHTSLIGQKITTTNMPSDIRDLCGIRWSFGCSTTDAAVAALGDDIRQYGSMSPVHLQGDDHVGVACMLLRTGASPFTLVKFPAIGEELADRVAAGMAERRRIVVPDDASALTSA